MIKNSIHLKETPSTNDYLGSLLRKEKPSEGFYVYCDEQTAGKGQIGNYWESEAGKNLTFSMVIYPEMLHAREQFLISQITSLGVIDYLKKEIPNVTIKWPNDIYVENKKIAGILIENVLCGSSIASAVLGIGLNLNQTKFVSNAPNPISLRQLTNLNYDIEDVLKQIRSNIIKRYTALIDGEEQVIRKEYLLHLYRRDGFHTYHDEEGTFEARIKGIEPAGFLVLEKQNGTVKEYAFKEVTFI